MAALNMLVESGFLESEVTLTSGQEIADRIVASSGRSGLVGRVLQVVGTKYEQALGDGHVNVLVLAPTDERKRLAADILQRHGGHFINFFGRLAIEQLA